MARKPKRGLTPKQIADIEEDYGLSYALFKAFPELNGLLQDAIKGNWSPARFEANFRNTNWFKKHSDVWRQNTALRLTDPATYKDRVNESVTRLQDLGDAMGARLSRPARRRLAERAFLLGWDDGQVKDILAKYVTPDRHGNYAGNLAAVENNLRTLATQNGIGITRAQLNNWMRHIARGSASQDQFEQYIKNQAAATFPIYGDQIKAGMTMMDIASPYIQSMASTLELNPASLNLHDRTIRRALSGTRDDKGNLQPVSITDFEDSLRQDRRWQFTQTAQTQARGYVNALSKMWGLS